MVSLDIHVNFVLKLQNWALIYFSFLAPCSPKWRVRMLRPIAVAARSKAWTVFSRLNAGIVGSNPTRGMDVCMRLFCVCVVLYVGSGLATGWFPVQGVLLTVYRIKKLKKRPRPNKRLENRKNKLRGLSPQAKYTDRATAACRWSCCQLLRIEGVAWPAQRIPASLISVL
jgi:hypothetical protein